MVAGTPLGWRFGWTTTEALATLDMKVIVDCLNNSFFRGYACVIVQALRQELVKITKPMPHIVYEGIPVLIKQP